MWNLILFLWCCLLARHYGLAAAVYTQYHFLLTALIILYSIYNSIYGALFSYYNGAASHHLFDATLTSWCIVWYAQFCLLAQFMLCTVER